MQFPPTGVTVITVTPQTIPARYRYQGVATASKHVPVRSNVSGVIVERPFTEGTDVQKGAVLFKIDTTIYAAALQNALGTLGDSKAKLDNAQRNLERLKGLVAEHAIAQKDYDDAEQAYKQAEADVAANQGLVDQARKNYNDTKVRAEITGRVGLAYLVLGARVTGPGDTLTSVDQIDPLYVTFNPPQEDILAWRRAIAEKRLVFPSGKLRIRAILADGTVNPQDGTLSFADVQILPQTGTQTLRATFANAGHVLLPGQFVKVELLDLKREGAILIPQRAVQQGLTGAYVFTLGDSNKVGIRPVQASAWAGSQWVIDQGLKAGDRVVVDGTQKIFPGAKVNPAAYNSTADSTIVPPAQDVPAAPSFPLVAGHR
jgi:membrane fusion protein, multidrug efflux system